MNIFQVKFHILLLCCHFLAITTCDVRYTRQPIDGHRCVATSNTEITLWSTHHPQCVWKCLTLKTCRYINYNYATGQCDLGLGMCESLVPAIGVAVRAFGPPRDTCVHWGSREMHGRVPVELQELNKVIYLARVTRDDALLVGKFESSYGGRFWANDEGVRVGPVYAADQDIEFLALDPTCILIWMPYTAGGQLPVGAISGGLLSDGCITYVSRVIHNVWPAFGYYNTKTELVYYELAGTHTKKSMEILVLPWLFQFIGRWTYLM